jgi:acyl-CoA hydrolase
VADWKERCRAKTKSLEEAVRSLPRRATVVVSMACMEPMGLLGNLHRFQDHFEFLTVTSCLNLGQFPFCEEERYQKTFLNENWFFGPTARRTQELGYRLVDYLPNNLHLAGLHKVQAEREQAQGKEKPPLVFWGMVTPMQAKSGFFNLGLSNVYELDVLEEADRVVLEVNEQAPRLFGETQVHLSQAHVVVEHSHPIPSIPILEPSETEERIAAHIAELIPDGATLQIGIGGIPNAVARLLEHKRELGIHTEMFTESMIDLFDAGVITNRKKNLWPGKFVFTFAMGTERMYRWLEDNPGALELRGRYVNDPFVVAQNDSMVSINTALCVDLSGQVCSESLGPRQFSGTGGQLDTHRGAVASRGGRGVIALRSTARGGAVSTIVSTLPVGSAVTVPRQDVDTVVTEHGVAALRGRTVSQRVRALAAVAHPDFRDSLMREARALHYL